MCGSFRVDTHAPTPTVRVKIEVQEQLRSGPLRLFIETAKELVAKKG